eukprot:Selendium_serpulae@DN6496_c1_g1_i18.p1
MLNAATNFGMYVQGGVLKGQEYSEEAPNWTDLAAMDKYEMNVVHQASSSLHRLQFRNVDVEGAPLVNVKIRANPHENRPDDESIGIRYKVDKCEGDEEGGDFQLRLASTPDEFGTYPLYITAFHNGHSLVLHQNVDNDRDDNHQDNDNLGDAYLRHITNEADLPNLTHFYLSREVPLGTPQENYEHLNALDTYILFNLQNKNALRPFIDNYNVLGGSTEWGANARFTPDLTSVAAPKFRLNTNSKFSLDQMVVHGATSNVLTAGGDKVRVGDGDPIDFELGDDSDFASSGWFTLKNTNINQQTFLESARRMRNNGNGKGSKGSWKLIRIFSDGATLAGATETGLPEPPA